MGDLNINNYIIHNSPDYAKDYPFIVATKLDDELLSGTTFIFL